MKSRLNPRLAALVLCAAAGCTQNTPPPEPASFARPTRVAFACVDKSRAVDDSDYLVSMAHCDSRTISAITMPVDAGTANYALHALVSQSSRGEVAAVDVVARHVIDNRPDIPGPTFLPAGEVPVAIAVAPDYPHTTYVANAGSRDISVLRTAALFKVQGAESFMKQRVPLQASAADAPAVPFDMLVSPDQDALFVSAADAGWIVRIPIKRCADKSDTCEDAGMLDTGAIQRIALEDSWAKLPAEAFEAQPTLDEPYRFTCPQSTPLLPTRDAAISLPARSSDVGKPQPTGLALDAFCEAGSCTRRLLVADRQQPIVHAIDLDRLAAGDAAGAVLTPILTGAPTDRVSVTPRVPVDLEGSGETQFVYAIDARDGSVLVAQDGRVRNVSVNPSQRADRLDLGVAQASGAPVAISLSVLTPDYDVLGSAEQWVNASTTPPATDDPRLCVDPDHGSRTVRRLRGVFLAVGATDGTVRVFTVHDMELKACRDLECNVANVASYNPFVAGYDPYPVVRNRARIALDYNTSNTQESQPLHPTVSPVINVEGSLVGVNADGTTNDTRAAGLDCVPCSANQVVSFPAPDVSLAATDAGMSDAGTTLGACPAGEGRVCSLADPFVEPLSWGAAYEGVIPGTRGGRGRFLGPDDDGNASGTLEFVGETPFCAAGVLGNDVLGQKPEAGDQLLITSVLPSDKLREQTGAGALSPVESDLCNALITARDSDKGAIAFGIRAAYGDRLQLDTTLVKWSSKQPAADWEDVRRCFAGQPLMYQVHSRGSFIVQSSGTLGFQHRVIEDPSTHHCQNDPAADARHVGRARPGEAFDNGLIAFKPSRGNFDPLVLLQLSSISNTPKLILNAADVGGTSLLRGVMPVDVRYNPGDQSLYVVDITLRGLLPVSLDPMPTIQSVSIQ